jgi:hypothetical protein
MIDDKLSGYYKVNNKIFYDKIQALLFATETKAEVTWHFFEETFEKVNWAIEPEISLDELYRLRALQIREQYDYIIVFCSGGADSTQTLYSFLKNGIKVDEVYAGAPISGLKNWKNNDLTIDNKNVISETFYTQLPFLEKIKSQYPDVKITVNDYFMDIINYQEDNWVMNSSDWIHPTTVARYSLEKFDHIKKICESGKKVAAIYGNSKPNVWIKDGFWETTIEDDQMNVSRPSFKDHPVDLVPFFTSHELPLIVSKQCHSIINYAQKIENKDFFDLLMFKSKTNYLVAENYKGNKWNHGYYERAIVPIIYPSLNYNEFQGLKPTVKILAEHDAWFYSLHKDTQSYKMMMSDLSNFLKCIDKRFFKGQIKTNFLKYKNTYTIKPLY